MINKSEQALANYIQEPKNSIYNFILARCYEEQGHTASAAGFYLRCAEFGVDDTLSYEALLRLGLCFQHQGSRTFTVIGIFLRAISLIHDRPEAYFLLSRIYEINRDWQEAYTWAILGEKLFKNNKNNNNLKPLITNVEYDDYYVFTFERAVSGWWIGLIDESLYLFKELLKNPNILDIYSTACENNLKNLDTNWAEPLEYNDSLYEDLKVKFNESILIKKNYSQTYQDMFVLTMLNGKKNGRYLEIGCGDPWYGNNTALLELNYNWSGFSIDIDKNTCDNFQDKRGSSIVICQDARKINYNNILSGDTIIDYLQIDADPSTISYEILLKIPFETHKFSVITFEHDDYADEKSGVREKSRKYLISQGYKLVVSDIAPTKYKRFEDWWCKPELIDQDIYNKMLNISPDTKKADEYMLDKIK
jgi:hypothetical protein